ncbi:MAG: DUF4434 domain-containing protein [Clostridia bacterium]|nr:DUF4434 domain-containing protein [Clostridia bacterium]MBQ9482362.1 DUF4434 domain-containing protein [Clostridia bacterium]
MKFPITGTFIDDVTYDIPSQNWSDEQWAKDLDYMKGVGIDTLILIRGGFYNRTNYVSKIFPTYRTEESDDFAGMILKKAAERNMKVFVGMYISNLTWNDGDAETEIKQNKLFVKEIVEKYGDIPSFYGWYIPHEVGNNILNITDIFSALSDMCKEKTPDKKVMISPFFYELSPKESAAEWDDIFNKSGKNIDICSFQDGSFGVDLMKEYYENIRPICKKHGIEFWQNAEAIERDLPKTGVYYPISFELLKRKIELLSPYAEKTIMFEFSHFLSPQSTYPAARNLYARYVDYYGKK